jgi:hypothetical protein
MSDRSRSMRARLALGGLAIVALIALVVVPIASAASPATPSATPSSPAVPTASAPATVDGGLLQGLAARRPLLAATVRAELTVVKRDGTTVLVHYERGQLTAVSATSITIRGRDGNGATFVVTEATRVRANGEAIQLSDLKVGDRAMVFGVDQGGTSTAFLVRCVRSTQGS